MSQRTPAEQDRKDDLLAYRLGEVEKAVKEVGEKVDRQENIKREDLVDIRDTIVSRFNEIRIDLQKQIDGKADKNQVDDLRTLIKAVGSILGSVIAGLVIFYLTRSK